MLSEPSASRSGNSGLVSSAKRRHLKPRHWKIPVSEHRSRTREHKLVHDTHRLIFDVARRSRGPFTHLCRAERGRNSAKVTLSPAKTTVLHFRCWSERKGGFGLPFGLPSAEPPAISGEEETASPATCRRMYERRKICARPRECTSRHTASSRERTPCPWLNMHRAVYPPPRVGLTTRREETMSEIRWYCRSNEAPSRLPGVRRPAAHADPEEHPTT